MWMKYRILFTILSAICVACVIPLGAFLGWTWAGVAALLAFTFYGLMLLCKGRQPQAEEQQENDENKSKDE